MKTLSANLLTHLAGELTTLATCWKITRVDTTEMYFTDHDEDITVSGNVYKAATGFSASAIRATSALNVDELEVNALLSSADITEADLQAGVYDFASVEIFLVNYEAPTDGTIFLRKGVMGEVRLTSNDLFFAEVRGQMQNLQSTFGEVMSATCRADLGDARCGVNLVPLTVSGTVATIVTQLFSFTASAVDGQAANYWRYGKVTWTSGNNSGYSHEVKSSSGAQIDLFNPPPYEIEVGDGFDVYPGCDKLHTTCNTKFSNIVNFRGEPFVPGIDRVVQFKR